MNEKLTAWVWQQDCQSEDKLVMLAILRVNGSGSMSEDKRRPIVETTGLSATEVIAAFDRLVFLGFARRNGGLIALAGAGVL